MTRPTQLSRRTVLGAAAGAGLAALAGGCSTKAAPSSTALQVWGGVPGASGPDALVAGFEEQHPGEEVVYTRFVNDDRGNLKLDSALQGGVEIDVYFTYAATQMALRAGSGMAMDLTDRVRADRDLAPYLDTTAPRATLVDGQMVALATAREPYFVLFNDTLREQAGVELPSSWDVDDFARAARELTGPGVHGTYSVPDTARVSLGSNHWYAPDGGSNFSDPAFLEWMQLGRTMIDDGSAYPWTEVLARQLAAYQQNPFLQGEFALWPTAPFNLRYLNDPENYPHDFRVAAAPVPRTARGDWNGGQFNNFIMINPRSTKLDLAWEFVRYWVTDGARAMLGGGKIPALDVLPDEEVLAGVLKEDPERFFDVDSFRHAMFTSQPKLMTDTNLTAVPEISLAVEQQRDLCWIGERTPTEAVATIDELADAAIRRNQRSA